MKTKNHFYLNVKMRWAGDCWHMYNVFNDKFLMDFDDKVSRYFGRLSKEKDNFRYIRISTRPRKLYTNDINVTMLWNEIKDVWDMRLINKFIMCFPDCENIGKIFAGLSKDNFTYYAIKIVKSK